MFFQEKKEEFAIWAVDKLNEDYPRKTLWIFFAAGFAGNLISWLTPLLIPDFIANATGLAINIESRVGVYLMIVPLSCVALMAFSLIRIVSPTKGCRLTPRTKCSFIMPTILPRIAIEASS